MHRTKIKFPVLLKETLLWGLDKRGKPRSETPWRKGDVKGGEEETHPRNVKRR